MFSSRIGWELSQNRLSKILARKREEAVRVIDLAVSNPTKVGLPYDGYAILSALSDRSALVYEPDPLGMKSAREAIADAFGQKADPSRLLLTASTSEAYSFLFRILCDEGDAVLVPRPSYPLFEFLAGLDGVRLLPYDLEYVHPAGWEIDFGTLAASAEDERVRAVLTVSPNNPTGSMIRNSERERLANFCAGRGLAWISDEVFSDFLLEPRQDAVRSVIGENRCLTFTLNGFSKLLGLPQLKLAWIAVSGPEVLAAEAMERLELVADTFLSVGTPVQSAVPALLAMRGPFREALLARARENLGILRQTFEGGTLRVLRVEGGWSAVIECPRFDADETLAENLLERENVLAYPGEFFAFQGGAHLISSLIAPADDTREGAMRMRNFFEG
jgi:hypothetical protein